MPDTSSRPVSATAADLLRRLPGPVTDRWPMGERFAVAFAHGSMSVEMYAPRGTDPQTPHDQDELYFIHTGTGTLYIDGVPHAANAGTVLFVAASVEHRFVDFSDDFAAWVVFWGPKGGEAA